MGGLWVADGSTSIGFSASVDNDLLRKPATTHMPTVMTNILRPDQSIN